MSWVARLLILKNHQSLQATGTEGPQLPITLQYIQLLPEIKKNCSVNFWAWKSFTQLQFPFKISCVTYGCELPGFGPTWCLTLPRICPGFNTWSSLHLDGESGSHLKITILNVLYLYNSIYVNHSSSRLGPNPDKSYFLLPLGLGPAIFNPEPNLFDLFGLSRT